MKRISVLAVLGCMFFASHASAWYSYTPLRYRVRYSPQALGYHHSGLIPGDMRYSMHAVGKNHSGLIPRDVRYSMHAVGKNHSGLVAEWTRYSLYDCGTRHNGLVVGYGAPSCGGWTLPASASHPQTGMHDPRPSDVGGHAPAPRRPRVARSSARAPQRRQTKHAKDWQQASRLNQRRIIQDYLRKTCPNNYRFARSFKVDSEYATFDVLLGDGQTIVKYWNPGFIAELKHMEGGLSKRYERYVQSWSQMCSTHEAGGGKVHHIVSNDTDQVMQQLCHIVEGTSSTDRVYCAALPPLGN